jgi:hypothetical protein
LFVDVDSHERPLIVAALARRNGNRPRPILRLIAPSASGAGRNK